MSAIELYARKTAGFDSRLAHTQAVLQSAASEHAGRIVLASSLGAEDMVLTDLIARQQLPVAIGTLLTGKLHQETLNLLQTMEGHYGIQVERHAPQQEAVVMFAQRHGERAMFESIALRKGCCQVRKLEPLARMLEGRSAWVTGLRREQSAQRGGVPYSEREPSGRLKFNPLADWTQADIWHYIERQGVPYNTLHDQFFPSIGCEPCTRAIAVGEDFRAGRWWWEADAAKECGLHIKTQQTEGSAA